MCTFVEGFSINFVHFLVLWSYIVTCPILLHNLPYPSRQDGMGVSGIWLRGFTSGPSLWQTNPLSIYTHVLKVRTRDLSCWWPGWSRRDQRSVNSRRLLGVTSTRRPYSAKIYKKFISFEIKIFIGSDVKFSDPFEVKWGGFLDYLYISFRLSKNFVLINFPFSIVGIHNQVEDFQSHQESISPKTVRNRDV